MREELLGYSDFSLHAFCYNAGPDFAHWRLNQSHMMASTKFRFLQKLLTEVRRQAPGGWLAGRVCLGCRGPVRFLCPGKCW